VLVLQSTLHVVIARRNWAVIMPKQATYDFIVIGAGSAGCAVAAGLAEKQAGSVLVVEAGPSDRNPLVKMPFGLVWLMGSKTRDWRYNSAPQKNINGRQLKIPRGRMLGGSGSINSMVWFRGRSDDFDRWNVPGWSGSDVQTAFEEVEAKLTPRRLGTPHPTTEALSTMFRANDPNQSPSPERSSAGVFQYNMRNGRRWSAADAFLRPVIGKGVDVITGRQVERIAVKGSKMRVVHFKDGGRVEATRGIVLSSGTIGSTEILLRSGIGPAQDLRTVGRTVVFDREEVGANLHDHPGAGIYYEGSKSGYGLDVSLAHRWAAAPMRWLFQGKGIFASPTVEGGAFFTADGGDGPPNIQSHFIPFLLGWQGTRYIRGRGYFADAVLCRPKSRGQIKLGKMGIEIDLGLFNDPSDLDTLTQGWLRLRELMDATDFGEMKAKEAFPAAQVTSEDEARQYVRERCGTAYHPVGTLRMGDDANAPVTPRLQFRGVDGLWVADASVMPAITSANTNAPSMMIGHRAGRMIAQDAS
jgi:choline dehydrogenase